MATQDNGNQKRVLFGIGGCVVATWLLARLFWGSSDATVTGLVTLDSKPSGAAQVIFVAEEVAAQSPLVAQTNDEGQFSLIGVTGAGIPPGKYRVMVSKMALPDGKLPAGEEVEQAREEGLLKNMVPQIYADRASSPLQVSVKTGTNSLKLELKSSP